MEKQVKGNFHVIEKKDKINGKWRQEPKEVIM